MSPRGRSLRHGIIEILIAAGQKAGFKISEREIQRRLQCARTYSTEAQIGHVVADLKTWRELADANFPAVPVPDGEPPADHRDEGREEPRPVCEGLSNGGPNPPCGGGFQDQAGASCT
jgi:hypothetical protein